MNARYTAWETVNDDDPAPFRVDDEKEGAIIAWCDSLADALSIAEAMNATHPWEGTEGQDRESYTDTQDRDNYS